MTFGDQDCFVRTTIKCAVIVVKHFFLQLSQILFYFFRRFTNCALGHALVYFYIQMSMVLGMVKFTPPFLTNRGKIGCKQLKDKKKEQKIHNDFT